MTAQPAFRTFLGQRVWPSPVLKLYFPFFISGSTAFFLFSAAHSALTNASPLPEAGRLAAKEKALKDEAVEWWNHQQSGKPAAH
ncbi:uncharacterized protein BJ171DRAFT_493015 [Polychytrium aggregatum]|uniref:uncharacterized protein n=1 Tax=Polychytrium aggregatum TaxID=110093 RepID=UPI0022FDF8F3|nr:uncharacterized protein BJ171DRAFT_493015 [Polychytrium aggregatum]KAI9207557.1 hypothetical protein BJ171DRAFT_493015 [Polychytrium aggregatum]